jgi:hypothetical protein
MEQIIFPLQQPDKGPEVKNLQDAIVALAPKIGSTIVQSLLQDPDFKSTFAEEVREQVFGQATRQVVGRFQELSMNVASTGIVDEATANAIDSLLVQYKLLPEAQKVYFVQGIVYDEWQRPLPNESVMVFDMNLRAEHLLGEDTTDADGSYTIHFTPDKFAGHGKNAPDIVVRLYGQDGNLVKSSNTFFNAPQVLQVSISLSNQPFTGPSEFDNLVTQITPLIGNVTIDQLTETAKIHDISYLASKISLPLDSLIKLIMAYRYEKWTRLTAQAYYGILRQNIPQGSFNNPGAITNLATNFEPSVIQVYNALWGVSLTVMTNAISKSITANFVPYALTPQLDSIQEQLQQLIQSPPTAPGQTGPVSSVYQKISLAGLTAQQQQTFLTQYATTRQSQSFWTNLSQDPAFQGSAAVLDKTQAVFQLSALTADNMPLVSALVQKNNITGMAGLATQAAMDATGWQNFITANNLQYTLPANVTLADYSSSLADLFEQAYPMVAFTAKLGNAANSSNPPTTPVTGPAATPATGAQATPTNAANPAASPNATASANTGGIPGASSLASFLTANPTFDFSDTHVNLFLNQQGVTIPSGTDQATLSAQLMAIQRIYKLAPAYEGVNSLVQGGILSARQIYGMGKTKFSNAYTGKLGQYQPDDVFEKAALQYGGALSVLGKLSGMVQTPSITALPDFKDMLTNSLITRAYPTLNTLFGVSDYCECLDCNSFLGQAAYLTDILEFLNQRVSNYPLPPASPQYTVREILLANGRYPAGLPTRRPDLGDIDLNCANTNVELPYIDISNELMEDYIAPPVFIIPAGLVTQADIKPGIISPALLAAITQVPNSGHLPPYTTPIYNILLLTAAAVVSESFYDVEFLYEHWVIRDTYITLKISLDTARTQNPNSPTGAANSTGAGSNPELGAADTKGIGIMVREIHETHLTTDQIEANPEYVNTNVYVGLALPTVVTYPQSIPFGLPFDLYFTQANTFLDKMGIHVWQLMETFHKENETSITVDLLRFFTACAYLNLSLGESYLAFVTNPFDTDQQELWGARIWGQANTAGVEVSTFLQYTGLDYPQLTCLLAMVSINGPGPTTADSSVIVFQDGNESCDTNKMNITNLLKESYLYAGSAVVLPTPPAPPPTLLKLTRLDALNRFLRLWPKTGLTMNELDACLVADHVGARLLDENTAVQLQHFLQLMNKLSLSAMQLLSFYQAIDTSSVNCLYNQLFQNLSISNPLVPQLAITALDGTGDIDSSTNGPVVMPVIMAACNVTADDLQFLLTNIKTASGGVARLDLANLSYIYRSSLLANQLSLSVVDTYTLMELLDTDPILVLSWSSLVELRPQLTSLFLTQFQALQTAGFSVDDLNYALTNQSSATPSLVPDTPTITAGLSSIRTSLQTVVTATTVVSDPKGALLSQWIADPVLNWPSGIAANLMNILGTADDSDYITLVETNSRFLQLLCIQYAGPDNPVYLDTLPPISFPDAAIAGTSYDDTTYNLSYVGPMSATIKAYLLALNTSDVNYTAAVDSLFTSSQTLPISTVALAALPAGVNLPDKNAPLLTYYKGTLSFMGTMSGPDYTCLLAQSQDPGYQYALNQLFIYSQDFAIGATVSVALPVLPVPAFPDSGVSGISYDGSDYCLYFKGQMTTADYQYLLTLNTTTPAYNAAIQFLYNNSQSFPVSTTILTALPEGVTLPDPNVPALTCFKGALLFSGAMSLADYQALLALSTDTNYQQALQSLFITSLPDNKTAAPLAALPAWSFSFPDSHISGITWSGGNLTFTGVMSTADLQALLALSDDLTYQAAVANLFALSGSSSPVSTPLAALPAWSFAFPDSNLQSISYSNGAFSFTGAMSPADLQALLAINNDPNYQGAMVNLFANAQAGSTASFTPPVAPATTIVFPDSNIASISYSSGTLSFTGIMSASDKLALLGLSTEPTYQAAIDALYTNSQASTAATIVTTPLATPASWTFAFPDSNITGISYSGGNLGFTGPMSQADLEGLLALSTDAGYQAAVKTLYGNALIDKTPNSTPLANPSSWQFSFPDSTVASLSYADGSLSVTGQMSPVDLRALSGINTSANYQGAIRTLYANSQINPQTSTAAVALAPINFPDNHAYHVEYTRGLITCAGKMSVPDYNNLLQINTDPDQVSIINFINNSAIGVSAIMLSSLPPVTFPASIAGLSYTNGTLSITGVMTTSDQTTLLSLSVDPNYQAAINSLYNNSQSNTATTINTIALPVLPFISLPTTITTLSYTNNILSITGAMTAADQIQLVDLSNYPDYQAAINDLYTNSNLADAPANISFVYPLQLQPLDLSLLSSTSTFKYSGGSLSFAPTPLSAPDYLGLLALSDDAAYQSAIRSLYISSLASSPGSNVTSSPLALPALVFPSIYSSQIAYDTGSQSLTFAGYMATEDKDALLTFSTNGYYQAAINALYAGVAAEEQTSGMTDVLFPSNIVTTLLSFTNGTSPDTLIPNRYAWFLTTIQPYYTPLKKSVALQQQLSSLFPLTAAVANQVLAYSNDNVYNTLAADDFVSAAKNINAACYPSQFYCYVYLARIAFFAGKFNMSAPDIAWLLPNSQQIGAINFLDVPGNWLAMGGTNNPNATFSAWESLNNCYVFSKKYSPVTIPDPQNSAESISLSVFTVLQRALTIQSGFYPTVPGTPVVVPDPGSFLSGLLTLTGWNQADLYYLLNLPPATTPANPLNLKIDNPVIGSIISLTGTHNLLRVQQCIALAAQLQVAASRCASWTMPLLEVTSTLADDIKQALKAHYPVSAQWENVIVPLQNTLREARRDALLAYLMANPHALDVFNDEYDVYSKFLIDIEMEACQPTTRIVQGYCSVQLFVQRCLMNLELNVNVVTQSNDSSTPFDENWSQWQWMSTYESWRRNRLIFLYPENFIQPELLPNQSSFFQDMQNDLTQNEVTNELAQTVFMNYLTSLDEVARLQVQGQWYDDASDTLHVFAGTYGGSPTSYYYRSLSSNRVWSPWEAVNLDIPDGHLVPVVMNGRIFLFWPVFTSTSDENTNQQTVPVQDSSGNYPPQNPPDKYWSIQMAYSEYQNGNWSPKKISSDSIQSMNITYDQYNNAFPDKPNFVFIPWDIPAIDPKDNPITNLNNSLNQGDNVAIACYYSSVESFGTADLYISSFFMSTDNVISTTSNWVDVFNNTSGTNPPTTIDIPFNVTDNGLAPVNSAVPPVVFSSTGSVTFDYKQDGFIITVTMTTITYTQGLTDSAADNAFQLNPCRGFPGAIMLSDPLTVPGTQFFDSSEIFDMLDVGLTPLSAQGQSKILNPPAPAVYMNSLSLQMSVFDKYLYIVSNGNNYPTGTLLPFFYQDGSRTYYVAQEIITTIENFYSDCKQAFLNDPGSLLTVLVQASIAAFNGVSGPTYHFYNFYHPYACTFIQLLFNQNLDAVINRNVQLTGDAIIGTGNNGFDFGKVYDPNANVYKGDPVTYWNGKTDHQPAFPKEDVDFALDAGYGLYNMEFFYYGVLMTAMSLSQNRQFETADHFYKYIFNPGDTSNYPSPQKYWVTKPFFAFASDSSTMDELITQLDLGEAPAGFVQSVTATREDPFDPFAIAQARTLPLMITTVMKYLDNLIAWGDSLFTTHTMESVNQALQIYLLAWEMLGTKPEAIPDPEEVPVCNYYQLETSLASAISSNNPDTENPWPSLSDPLVQIENMIPVMTGSGSSKQSSTQVPFLPSLPSLLYFCIPPNYQLLQYWDTVADRLYKIRHCENIEGQFDPLSPFPGGAGLYGQDADNMNDLNGMQLYYRFTVMIQKASGLCSEVKSLGAALLAALEKKDAEALALLRAGQEISVQNAVMQIKQLQVTDAQYALDNLNNYQVLVQTKMDYYQGLINGGLNTGETTALALNTASTVIDDSIALGYTLAGGLHAIPDFIAGVAGFGGTAAAQVKEGGENSGNAAKDLVATLSAIATGLDKSAALAATTGGYARRSDEWQFQLNLATNEMAQVQSQISGATTRLTIANQDVQNQQLLINNANDINSFLLNKYTNEQLYSWMITQISNVYFSGYQLAYMIAKRAEVCWQFELGLSESSYITYGYWNSLKSGLLAGEQMMNDISQMEMDYLKLNAREFELTKNISMAQFDPVALLQLKTTGECFINLPEELFDMDYPGHYFRRIKTVSITIPCVAGPYTTVSCTLTITTNSIRISNDASGKYPRNTTASGQPANDSRFGDNAGITASIATSSAVNDNGLFQLNFNDERYLPFEFSGAISSWYIQMPSQFMQFDYNSISDLIIQLRYTSRDGGAGLQAAAQANLQSKLTSSLTTPGLGLFRVFSAKRDFPTQWYKFLNSPNANGTQELDLAITERFPYFTKNPGMTIAINQLAILADSSLSTINLGLEDPTQHVVTAALSQAKDPAGEFGSLLYASQVFGMNKPAPGTWEITYSAANNASNPPQLSKDTINDLIIVFYYKLQKSSN